MPRPVLLLLLLATLLADRVAAAEIVDDEVLVTCGSVIKLEHGGTKSLLHSHEVAYQYGSGSGQQSVTGYPDGDDAGSYWTVRGPTDAPCSPGAAVRGGDFVRLQHRGTSRWLHSHLFKSPLTHNQEVSAFGDDSTSDTGDVWQLELEAGKGKGWAKDARMRLKHKDTSMFLITHARKYGRPIAGHQEVCAVKAKGPESWWRATEGVYFPARGGPEEL